MPDSSDIGWLLHDVKTIAVVGLSADPSRPSHQVAAYLQSEGFRIVPVNPNLRSVLGVEAFPSLLEIPEPIQIDLVNVFRRPEAVLPVAEEAIKIGARGIWMQEGVIHPVAAQLARKAGLWVVMDRCLMVEHHQYVSRSL
ncbi:MAG: CoA-binding protein [Acidimicrobiia bacterium]|nr:CoA-binding protein [Acidimicrobiia bacterium]